MVVLGITPVVNTFCFVSFSNQSSTSSTSKLLPKIQPHAQGQRWTLDMTWTHELLIGTYRLWNNPYPIEKDFIPPKKNCNQISILLMKIIPKWNWLGFSSPKKAPTSEVQQSRHELTVCRGTREKNFSETFSVFPVNKSWIMAQRLLKASICCFLSEKEKGTVSTLRDQLFWDDATACINLLWSGGKFNKNLRHEWPGKHVAVFLKGTGNTSF